MAEVRGYTIKNQWMNFSLYFINFMYKTKRNPGRSKVCQHILPQKIRLKPNSQPIGGNQSNTQFLGDGRHYQTDFIEVNKDDFVDIFFKESYIDLNTNLTYPQYGMRLDASRLKGTYKRDATGVNAPIASNINQEINNGNDPTQYYFLKGAYNNDIIQYLINSKVV